MKRFSLFLLGCALWSCSEVEANVVLVDKTSLQSSSAMKTAMQVHSDSAQTQKQAAEAVNTDSVRQTPPSYLGGTRALYEAISANIRYPKSCIERKIQGVVVLRFTVTRKGKIRGISVQKSLHPDADAEAVRVLRKLKGKWKPAYENGKAVDVHFVLPIRFVLSSDNSPIKWCM